MQLSIVVPIFNERENIAPFFAELAQSTAAWGDDCELIFVDDGSSDGSCDELERLASTDGRMLLVKLSRNFGQTAAMAAGIAHSTGEVVVLIDGDRQNDPADIGVLLAKLDEGYDLVAGWRVNRQDSFLVRLLPSRVANWMIGRITGVRLHDYGCTFKVMRGELARSLRLYGEMHRFIPALVDDLGGRIVEVPVNHRPRLAGESKYGLSRTVRVILDLVTVKFLSSYATRPIHVFGVAGLLSTAVGLSIVGWLGFERLYLGSPIADRPIVLLGILLTIMGLQFVTMGLLGELLVRTYHESQEKPVYRIEKTIGRRIS